MLNLPREIPFRPDIQGLRAVAIAIVVLAHANVPGFAGGFVGVDVFFVLSGFLITGLLMQERQRTGTILYGRFLARRLRRLLPALLVMLVIVLLLTSILLSTYEARMQTGSFLFASTWTSNFYFAFAEFNYFAALEAKDFFLHTWSLGIEEQFYVVWPWLVSLSFAIASIKSNPGRDYKSMLAVIAIVFASSLGLSLYWAQTSPLLSFYMMPSRGWQFALGASVFVYTHNHQFGHSAGPVFLGSNYAKQLAGAIGLLLVVSSAMLLHADLNYPGYFALFPSAGAALLILAGTRATHSGANKLLASKIFVWLGDRSYSLYLWHWPVLLLGGAYGFTSRMLGTASLIFLSIALATLSYRFIEIPLWKGRFSKVSPRAVGLTSTLAVATLFGASQFLVADVFSGTAVSGSRNEGDPRADAPAVFSAGFDCDSWFSSAEVVPCRSGNSAASHTAILIGDSIGAQWAAFLPEIYTAPNWQILVLTKSACAIADVEYYYKPVGGLYDVCTEWRNASVEYIAELKPDIVFVGSSASHSFSESEWVGGTERLVAKLAAAAQHVVVIPGSPELSFDGPSCIKEPYRFTSRLRDSKYICEEGLTATISDDVAGFLERAVSGISNAYVLNINDIVCPERRCSALTKDGVTVFRDNQHLTASFVFTQVPAILTRLNSISIGPSDLAGGAGLVPIKYGGPENQHQVR